MIGFVILSHRDPPQLLRLIRALNRLYDCPPIACHHDVNQSPIDLATFPKNVRFVTPALKTSWAKWPATAAAIRAIKLLLSFSSAEWFVLLSGSDYPIAKPDKVLDELGSSSADAFIDFRKVGQEETAAMQYGPRNPELWLFETTKGQRLGWDRYLRGQLWIPVIKRGHNGKMRLGRLTFYPNFDALNSPFDRSFECYHGDFWFSANRRAAEIIANPSQRHLALQRYLRFRMFPEEAYFQTVLCNEPDLRLNRDNKRFAVWTEGADHPAELGVEHLPSMLNSGAHFARKFAGDAPVLDRLDNLLG